MAAKKKMTLNKRKSKKYVYASRTILTSLVHYAMQPGLVVDSDSDSEISTFTCSFEYES